MTVRAYDTSFASSIISADGCAITSPRNAPALTSVQPSLLFRNMVSHHLVVKYTLLTLLCLTKYIRSLVDCMSRGPSCRKNGRRELRQPLQEVMTTMKFHTRATRMIMKSSAIPTLKILGSKTMMMMIVRTAMPPQIQSHASWQNEQKETLSC